MLPNALAPKPIEHDWPVFRPPSEADSLILQATLGCTHNRCAFCAMYQTKRFRIRKQEELLAEIAWAGQHLGDTRRVFLADGDAFALSTERMLPILESLYQTLPRLERVSAYACPQNFRGRTFADLQRVRQAGLQLLYFGLESGDDEVLRRIQKGADAAEMIAACQQAQTAGFELSLTMILGLAGPSGSERHAQATARAVDAIRPRWASALTLMPVPREPSFEQIYGGSDWRLLSPVEALAECRILLAEMQAEGTSFRSNHASNYLALKGDLQRDKTRLLHQIDRVLADPHKRGIKPEFLRGL